MGGGKTVERSFTGITSGSRELVRAKVMHLLELKMENRFEKVIGIGNVIVVFVGFNSNWKVEVGTFVVVGGLGQFCLENVA
jgi:hypothetical protein